MSNHELFGKYAHRYDAHTPPHHYKHDHRLVLELAVEKGLPCRLLDVGCGTGVLLEKAQAAGIEVTGTDASAEMIVVARNRVPGATLRVERMQELEDEQQYDLITCLSWSLQYCRDEHEMEQVLRRMYRALAPSGRVLLHVAHGPNISPEWVTDVETGPTGLAEDITFRFRFEAVGEARRRVIADYAYRCQSAGEQFEERHELNCADAVLVGELATRVGFRDVEVWDTWRRDELATGGSPFVFGVRC